MRVIDYAKEIGMTPYAAAKRLQRAGMSSSLLQEVNDQIKEVLSLPAEGAKKRGRHPVVRQVQRQPAVSPTATQKVEVETQNVLNDSDSKKTKRPFAFDAFLSIVADIFLVLGVVAHCVLVVQELVLNAGQIGATAGIFVSLIYAASLVLSIMPRFYEQSFTLILVIFFLDMCSIYLHYVSFRQTIAHAFALGLSIIVGTCAFYCSYLFRSKHLVDDSDNA
jgi:hypothetical protein